MEGIGDADSAQADAIAGKPRIQSGTTQGLKVEGDSTNGGKKQAPARY